MSVDVASPTSLNSPNLAVLEDGAGGVSWRAIAAGAVAAASLTLVLVAFGAGLGLSMVSPWSDEGVSASTFNVGAGIYLCVVAVMASAVGGYLAARLRGTWHGYHTNETFFRDTAQGLIAWAFATLLIVVLLGATTSGVLTGVAGATSKINPSDVYVDKWLRPMPGAQPRPAAGSDATRAELGRLWSTSFSQSEDLTAGDRPYVAQQIAAVTGLSQADAEKRLNDIVAEAKDAADKARNVAMKLSFWLAASMLLGALAACLAAVEGGSLRDGTWNGRVLTPRSI
jgi:hypothetical protein